MKQYFLVPILILALGFTACSPATTNLEEIALGEISEQAITTVVTETDVDADIKIHLEELPTTTPSPESDPSQEAITETLSEEDTAPVELYPTMPIMTETHQGFTYRPGQVVAVLAEGFEEGDTLAVTLVHEDQGQINTFSVSPVSSLGNIPIYHPVEIDEAGIYPDGKYTFRVSESDGTQKTYTFSLDYLNPAETAPFEGCGVYPEPVLDSIIFAWCTGYMPSAAPLDIRGVVDGEELFSDIVDTIYSDGVALYVLDIFDDDPAGYWTLTIGQDELTFDVPGETHE